MTVLIEALKDSHNATWVLGDMDAWWGFDFCVSQDGLLISMHGVTSDGSGKIERMSDLSNAVEDAQDIVKHALMWCQQKGVEPIGNPLDFVEAVHNHVNEHGQGE